MGSRSRGSIRAAAPFVAVLVALTGLALAPAAAAQDTAPTRSTTQASDRWARWFDAQAASVAARYNYIEDGRGRMRHDRIQTQVQVRGRVTLDAAGRYSVHAGLFTGNTFTSGWNSTGIGTGQGSPTIYVKHLFAAAEPWHGLELHYGSMAPARGEWTEITGYDNDAYITAARVSVRRPREAFFDVLTVSAGYVGDLTTPFVFDRTGALWRHNYRQLLVSKQLVPGLTWSADYSEIAEDGVLRHGVAWRLRQPWIDLLAAEYGVQVRGGSQQAALAVRGTKQVGGITVEAGYANVDPVYGTLNGDRYGRGDRVFTAGSLPLPLDLVASWFVQNELSKPADSSNGFRFDLVIAWDLLKGLRRAGALP